MHTKNFDNQKGFTIIELVMVIVIIGILAAVAVPKFVDLKSNANNSVLKGVQGSINGAIVMLHSRYIINTTSLYTAGDVVANIVTNGLTGLAAGAAVITASVDASCSASWTYTANGGVSSMASIGAMASAGC